MGKIMIPAAAVLMNPTLQKQAPPPEQHNSPQQHRKPHKQFRKRGHNKGRRQITEEVMFPGKARSTRTFPQSGDATACGSVQVKGKILTPAAAVPVTTVPVMMNPAHQQQAPPPGQHDSLQQHKSPHKQSVSTKLKAKPELVPEPEAADIQDVNTKSSAPEKEETKDHRVEEELAIAKETTVLSMPMQKIDLNSKVAKQMLDACKEFLSLSCPSGYAPTSGSEQTKGKIRTPAAAFPVSTVPVMMNQAHQQQALLPKQQAPPRPDRRPRKQIIIRDPAAGGRDVTEEIMSGRMTRSTPPHGVAPTDSCSIQTQGESLTSPAAVPVQLSYVLPGTAANKETGFLEVTPTPAAIATAVTDPECIPVARDPLLELREQDEKVDAVLEQITEPVVTKVQEISAKTSIPAEEKNEDGRVEEKPAPTQETTMMQPVLSMPMQKIDLNSKVARQMLDTCKEFLYLSCLSGYAPVSGSVQTKGKIRTPAAAFPVTTVPVLMNPTYLQQAPPPGQLAPPWHYRRPCKQIIIRDPAAGGRDITEEVMSGRMTTFTCTPPQDVAPKVSCSVQTQGETLTPPAAVPVQLSYALPGTAANEETGFPEATPTPAATVMAVSDRECVPMVSGLPQESRQQNEKVDAELEPIAEPVVAEVQQISVKTSGPADKEKEVGRVKEEPALTQWTTMQPVLAMPRPKIDLNIKGARQMLGTQKEFLYLSCPSGYAPVSGSVQTKGKIRTPSAALPVTAVPVKINPAHQQQTPPLEQQAPPWHYRRPHKQIRIQDPAAGGRDITEEIMSGKMTTSTRTPPHDVAPKVSCSVQMQGEILAPPAAVPVQLGYALPGTAANKETVFHVTTPTRAATVTAVSELKCVPAPNFDAELEPITVPVVAEVQEMSAKTSASAEEENEDGRVEEKAAPAQGTTMQPVLSVQKKKIGMNNKVARQVLDACKEIRIRNPCAGGRDITEEIMSGRMTTSTRTPPDDIALKVSCSVQTQGESLTPPAAVPVQPSYALPGTAANKETGFHEVTPTPAATVMAVSELDCIPVARGLLLEPSEQDEKVDAELEPITDTVVAKVQKISAKTLVPAEEENEDGRVEKEPTATQETTMQDVPSVPKKKSDPNNKVLGNVYDAYEELKEVLPSCGSVFSTALEEMKKKEDKLDTVNTEPTTVKPVENKYEEEHSKAIKPKERKTYDREFLLSLRFTPASMCEPENFHIINAILKEPSQPCKFQQGQQKKPRRIITGVCLSNDVQLNKAHEAWTPVLKKSCSSNGDPEIVKTQELLRKMRGILNKMTPQMFNKLMKQVTELTIDTEDRLKGVVDLIFEKAIAEPMASVTYANMCHCLMRLKVPILDKPGASVNFHRLLLIRCQEEFEKDRDNDKFFKQKELDATTKNEICLQFTEELEEEKSQVQHRSVGNIKFIGELFKMKMLTEPIMHYCITELLKNQTENSLECLCKLLTTIGKDLDFEKTKPCMDRYFRQMEKIIQEKKASSRICFMLQDVLDLRRNNWVSQRGVQDPKTINQIHKEAELEEKREQIKVQQQLLCKKAWSLEKGDLLSKPQGKSSALDTSHLKFQSQQCQHKRPHRFITSLCLSNDVQLNKAEEAWTTVVRKSCSSSSDPEMVKTQELLRKMRSILNKMTPQMFNKLMKQVTKLTIDTEDRLKGVVDLIFEKAITEPMASVTYANMCHCLMRLKVSTSDKPGASVNFHSLLLNRCQEEFEKVRDKDKIVKQEKLNAATEEACPKIKDKLEEEKSQLHRRSLGNIKFIGELFKLKMVTEPIMQYCITKLLKNQTEDSLECLCKLLTTIGKDLNFEKTKPCMDQYFHQMEKIIQERKISSRIRFILQNVLDLRRNNWVLQQVDQDPKTINQIHKEAELEEKREQIKVQQQLLCKKAWSLEKGGLLSKPQDKSSVLDTSHLKR
ncbi:eukaryotic translation initiation factor 4 gamma 1-like [Clarias gariepinus]|uniref:eukaryotic translation initiation factor 4 gamma 1-like n=1 Tax=Clarias gariepinus TaxID=13013 RepID=UPI00234DBA2F|nr:eukaryotic translation initiation factor 4 gamma 1-like [Clarias gariepinus]